MSVLKRMFVMWHWAAGVLLRCHALCRWPRLSACFSIYIVSVLYTMYCTVWINHNSTLTQCLFIFISVIRFHVCNVHFYKWETKNTFFKMEKREAWAQNPEKVCVVCLLTWVKCSYCTFVMFTQHQLSPPTRQTNIDLLSVYIVLYYLYVQRLPQFVLLFWSLCCFFDPGLLLLVQYIIVAYYLMFIFSAGLWDTWKRFDCCIWFLKFGEHSTALEKKQRRQWMKVGNSRQSSVNESRACFECHISYSTSCYVLSFCLSILPLIPLSFHLMSFSLFLHYCFLTTCPFFSLFIQPSLHLSRRSVVIWTDVSAELIIPSSCCLPTATLFPSCVSVSLPLLPSASPCHSRCLAPFRHLSLLPALWLSFLPSILLPPSLLFPSETGLSGRFSHLSTCGLMLFCLHCACIHELHAMWYTCIHIYMHAYVPTNTGECVCVVWIQPVYLNDCSRTFILCLRSTCEKYKTIKTWSTLGMFQPKQRQTKECKQFQSTEQIGLREERQSLRQGTGGCKQI